MPAPAAAPAPAASAQAAPSTAIPPPPPPSPVTRPAPGPAPNAPREPGAVAQATATLFGIVRANPFASVGVLLVLVGVGFLFALLAASNILPPALRVALVAIAGAALFVFGTRHEEARPTFANNLQGGAIAVQFLCALWAHDGYGLVGPTGAFIWMGGLSAAAVAWAALRGQGLFAFLGIVGSLLTPIAASTGSGTFSSLLGYCLWVSLLGLGIARYLRMPTLASTTLAGIAALLGAALGLPLGAVVLGQGILFALLALYVAAALAWTTPAHTWAARQQASIVGMLVGAPLLATGLLFKRGGLSQETCAVVLGGVVLLMLGWLLKASKAWQAWLLPIGGGLGIIALAVGLDGPARAIGYAVSALGFVLTTRARPQRWLDGIAFVYWLLALQLALVEMHAGATSAVVAAGLVALAAGFLTRTTLVSLFYTGIAPLVLWHAINANYPLDTTSTLLLCTGWAIAALLAGRALGWKECRLSAAWILAGVIPVLFDHALPGGLPLVLREFAFVLWLAACAVTVDVLNDDGPAADQFRACLEWASLAIPALVSLEAVRLVGQVQGSSDMVSAVLAAVWCGWCAATALPAVRFDFMPRVVGAVGALLLALHAMFAHIALASELVACASLAALCYTAWTHERGAQGNRRRDALVALAVAGLTVVSLVLRVIGARIGLDHGAATLLFERSMQPVVSLLWAGASIATVVIGSRLGSRFTSRRLWLAGGAAMGVLVLKMLLVDLATFSLVAKVGVFLATGVAFIALGRFCPVSPEAQPEGDRRT